MDEDERPVVKAGQVIGEDLTRLSVAEIEARIGALRAEIDRLSDALRHRSGVMSAADALFKR